MQPVTHLYLDTDIPKLEDGILSKSQVKVLQIQSLGLEQIQLGHHIAKQTLWHAGAAKGLEVGRHEYGRWSGFPSDGMGYRQEAMNLVPGG